jgi:thiamine-phosphate pyrophosphorylase
VVPRLIVITDWRLPAPALLERLAQTLEAGPGIAVQHRQPGAPVRDFVANARAVQNVCRAHDTPLFINGRLDVALALDAHLHLRAGGMTAREARPHLPKSLLSVACHDAAEAHQAQGADLALVSPVFRPGSKPDDARPPLGAAGFRALSRALPCPAFALGGMTSATVREVSCQGIAVMSAIWDAADPRAAASALLEALAC